MTKASYIFLAGASRGVGREIANYLTNQLFAQADFAEFNLD